MPHPSCRLPATTCRPVQRDRGFFLLELLGVLALIAVLVGLVLPGLQQVIRTHRVRSVARDFSAELFWAQAEAVRRGSALVLRLKAASECTSAPAGPPVRCGWDVFADNNLDGLQQPGETTVHTYTNPAGLTITPNAGGGVVFIDTAGNLRNKGSANAVGTSFLVEPVPAGSGDPASRKVCINAGNRVRIAGSSECQS